jgi:hypothetical protein
MRSMVEATPRPRQDSSRYHSGVPHDLISGDSQYGKTTFPQQRIALFVSRCADHRVVRPAVDFHNQPGFAAEEIDDIGLDRMLSAKLQTAGLPA